MIRGACSLYSGSTSAPRGQDLGVGTRQRSAGGSCQGDGSGRGGDAGVRPKREMWEKVGGRAVQGRGDGRWGVGLGDRDSA